MNTLASLQANAVTLLTTGSDNPTLELRYHQGSTESDARYLRATYDHNDIVVTLLNPSLGDIVKLYEFSHDQDQTITLGSVTLSDTASYNESSEPVNPSLNLIVGDCEIQITDQKIAPVGEYYLPVNHPSPVVMKSSYTARFGIMTA